MKRSGEALPQTADGARKRLLGDLVTTGGYGATPLASAGTSGSGRARPGVCSLEIELSYLRCPSSWRGHALPRGLGDYPANSCGRAGAPNSRAEQAGTADRRAGRRPPIGGPARRAHPAGPRAARLGRPRADHHQEPVRRLGCSTRIQSSPGARWKRSLRPGEAGGVPDRAGSADQRAAPCRIGADLGKGGGGQQRGLALRDQPTRPRGRGDQCQSLRAARASRHGRAGPHPGRRAAARSCEW